VTDNLQTIHATVIRRLIYWIESKPNYVKCLPLGAVHKRHPQSGEIVHCGLFSNKRVKGASSDAGVRSFWCIKLRIFRNLWRVRTDRKRGGEPERTFCGQGEGQFFAIFYGRLLLMPS